MHKEVVLLLPGWQNSGPEHWQSLWELRHGYLRVDQHNWMQPLRGDWVARLEEVVLAQPADAHITLVAHSLGCHLTAAWAAHSQHTARVHAALLVAPPDVSATSFPPQLHRWAQPVLSPLPFRSRLVASADDPYCSFDAAAALARHWGSDLTDIGARGHVNSESGLGDWPEGHAMLQALQSSRPGPAVS